jgi:hypothetical protein
MTDAAAKLAYDFHAKASAAGAETWEWEDLPAEARQHWRQLVGHVLDYRTEHRRSTNNKPKRPKPTQ